MPPEFRFEEHEIPRESLFKITEAVEDSYKEFTDTDPYVLMSELTELYETFLTKNGLELGVRENHLVLNVVDHDRFNHYLTTFTQPEESRGIIQNGFINLKSIFDRQISLTYDLADADAEDARALDELKKSLEALANACTVIAGPNDLSLKRCAEIFSHYKQAIDQGFLEEYIKIREILDKYGIPLMNLAPASIEEALDTNPVVFAQQFRAIAEVLTSCVNNPQMHAFIAPVFEKLPPWLTQMKAVLKAQLQTQQEFTQKHAPELAQQVEEGEGHPAEKLTEEYLIQVDELADVVTNLKERLKTG